MAFIDTVKAWFNSGDEPTQAQFFQKFAWLRWKDEKVPTADVDGLNDLLIAKADKVPFDVHLADAIKHITPQERAAWNGDIPISRITDLQAFISSVNTLLASDDVTLDELQEIVTYIKQNKSDLQNLSVPNIAGLEDALASKITKNETGDENKFFNEKGIAVAIPEQLQADFNQTDNTKPDYIKGFPIAVLDHNGAKKFDAKEIQFDENFEFNPAENEVNFKSEKYVEIISKITSTITNSINSAAITTDKEYVRDLPDALSYNASRAFLELTNTIAVTWQNNNVSVGDILPEYLELEIGIRLVDCSINWTVNDTDMILFKQRINQSEISNIISSVDYLHTYQNTIFKENQVFSGSPTDKIGFSKKTMDYLGNVISNFSVSSFLRNLENNAYKRFDAQTQTQLYIKSKVKFNDEINANGLNAPWSFGVKILDFKIKK